MQDGIEVKQEAIDAMREGIMIMQQRAEAMQ
jgi:hypothetical protein